MRTTFDQISLSLIAFLEAQAGICNVEYVEKPRATEVELNRWHDAHRPYRLPADLQSFYSLQNGLLVRWRMRYRGDQLPLGCLNINALNQIEGRDVKDAVFLDADRRPVSIVAAFDLDHLCLDGRVVLAFSSERDVSGIYFQDLSCMYYFISASFTSYLRLLFVHIGLPRWQYAFTASGLPQSSIQWFRLLIPRRLQLDLQLMESFQNEKTVEKPKDTARSVVIDLDKIEKNARLVRARDANNKQKHKKSTSDLPSASSDSAQPRPVRPGSAPGRRPGPTGLSVASLQARTLVRPETGARRQIRGSFG